MSITVIDRPEQAFDTLAVEVPQLFAVPEPATATVDYDPDPVIVAVQRQAAAASAAVTRVESVESVVGREPQVDTQAWLFAERARYRAEGTCDPYAMLMLMRAGMLPVR